MSGRIVKLDDPDREDILAELRGERGPGHAPGKPSHDYKSDLVDQLHHVGIPIESEFYFARPEREYRADWLITGTNLLIEYEGGLFQKGKSGHSSVGGILRDIEKGNVAAERGYRVIRVAPNHVKDGRALKWIEAAYKRATE